MDNFIIALYMLAEHCKYGGHRDEMIRRRFRGFHRCSEMQHILLERKEAPSGPGTWMWRQRSDPIFLHQSTPQACPRVGKR